MASSDETAREYWLLEANSTDLLEGESIDDLLYVDDGSEAVDGSSTDDVNGGGEDDLQGGGNDTLLDVFLPSNGGDGLIIGGLGEDVFLFGIGEGDAFITGIPEGGIEDTLVMDDATFDFLGLADGMEEPSYGGDDPGIEAISAPCEIQLRPADFVL